MWFKLKQTHLRRSCYQLPVCCFHRSLVSFSIQHSVVKWWENEVCSNWENNFCRYYFHGNLYDQMCMTEYNSTSRGSHCSLLSNITFIVTGSDINNIWSNKTHCNSTFFVNNNSSFITCTTNSIKSQVKLVNETDILTKTFVFKIFVFRIVAFRIVALCFALLDIITNFFNI